MKQADLFKEDQAENPDERTIPVSLQWLRYMERLLSERYYKEARDKLVALRYELEFGKKYPGNIRRGM